MRKCNVNGEGTHNVFSFLWRNSVLYDWYNKTSAEIPWNFTKFLVDGKDGFILKYYNPETNPLAIRDDIKMFFSYHNVKDPDEDADEESGF